MLELVPDPADSAAGAGRGLQFRWRLSTTSGIPRQNWGFGDQPKPAPDADPSS